MELLYQIVRSARRKKVTLTVERDRQIVVHAPAATTDEEIREVVESRRAWLGSKVRHAQKYQERPHAPGKEIVNGESALYLGREYRIELADTTSGAVEFTQKFMIPSSRLIHRKAVLREWYQARAEQLIVERARRHAEHLGVVFTGVKIVDNPYRWGSCTAKGQLHFNWRLIKAPMFVIDYVVIHELAHLLEPNHTERFWNIVQAKVPTTTQARQWLKERGQLLEEEI